MDRYYCMAVIVYSWCWIYSFISQLEYSWVEYQILYMVTCLPWEGAYWPRHTICTLILLHEMTKLIPEGRQGYTRVLNPHAMHYFEWWSCKECKFYLLAAGISSGSQLRGLCPSILLYELQSLNKNMTPLLLLRWARRRSGGSTLKSTAPAANKEAV